MQQGMGTLFPKLPGCYFNIPWMQKWSWMHYLTFPWRCHRCGVGRDVGYAEWGSYWDCLVAATWKTNVISNPGTAFLRGLRHLKMVFPYGPRFLVK